MVAACVAASMQLRITVETPGLRGACREERDQWVGSRQAPLCTGRILRKECTSSIRTGMVRLEG